jgi:hypothetical protein
MNNIFFKVFFNFIVFQFTKSQEIVNTGKKILTFSTILTKFQKYLTELNCKIQKSIVKFCDKKAPLRFIPSVSSLDFQRTCFAARIRITKCAKFEPLLVYFE